MKAGHRAGRDRRTIVIVVLVSAAASAVFGYLAAPPGFSRLVSSLLGVVNAITVATPIVLFEVYRTHLGATDLAIVAAVFDCHAVHQMSVQRKKVHVQNATDRCTE